MRAVDPMTWRLVSPLLDRALDIADDERAGFLAEVRTDRPDLAPLLEDLLIEHGQLRDTLFLEAPDASDPPASSSPRYTLAGTVVGAYTLEKLLGAGGMGSVWRAQRTDGRFEGAVAVKLLHLAALDAGGAERFRREGTVLARLSHPHIARLFDAGVTTAGQPYLVLEYVEGVAIDRYADDHKLDVRARLDLFQQVTDAVAHAHAHSIVHRDLKPSNVLVDTEGRVKLLDFGIAKLLDADADAPDAVRLTQTDSQAWTPAYAAPEQVRGEPASTATDVYTLGVLLYHLLVEAHPTSQGCTTPASYLQSILEVEPVRPSTALAALAASGVNAARIASNRATTPAALRHMLAGDLDNILAMALRKAPERRYPSVTAFADDVRRYLRDQPVLARGDLWRYRAQKFLRRHRVAAAALAGIAIALAAAAAAITLTTRRTAGTSPDTHSLGGGVVAAIPITSEAGEETWPSFSPDGTQLVFAWLPAHADEQHLAIKTIGASPVVEMTHGPGADSAPVWSPDGKFIAFLKSHRDPELKTQVCLMPASGGAPRVLHEERHIAPGLAWWKQGNALLFATQPSPKAPFGLGALDLATLRVTLLTTPPPAPLLATPGDRYPAVSPDGRTAAFVRETHDGENVYLLDLSTRKERRLTFEPRPINGLAWQPDGSAVLMSAILNGVDVLYRAALADGKIVRLPLVDDWAKQPAIGPDGRLAFSRRQGDSNIYRADLREPSGDRREPIAMRPIIASSRADESPRISPDGRLIAFESSRSGGGDIWIAAADGARPRQLTFLQGAAQPFWSPDGRVIAFAAAAPGQMRPDIWVVDARGGTPRQLTSDPSYDTLLGWSADGQWLYFRSDQAGSGWDVWRVPVSGGATMRVTTGGGLRAQESRDGVFLYYSNDVPEIWRRRLRASAASATNAANAANVTNARDAANANAASASSTSNELDTKVMVLPRDSHWGGDWFVGERGIYYVNPQSGTGPAIELLPFRAAGAGAGARDGVGAGAGVGVGRVRPIRILPLAAPFSGGAPFTIAWDESWLAWSQEDHRAADIMMIERVP
jgi:Tol biopolymer transport system component/serine/threonine protein kinase